MIRSTNFISPACPAPISSNEPSHSMDSSFLLLTKLASNSFESSFSHIQLFGGMNSDDVINNNDEISQRIVTPSSLLPSLTATKTNPSVSSVHLNEITNSLSMRSERLRGSSEESLSFHRLASVSDAPSTEMQVQKIPQFVHVSPECNPYVQLCFDPTNDSMVISWMGNDRTSYEIHSVDVYIEGPFDPFLDDIDSAVNETYLKFSPFDEPEFKAKCLSSFPKYYSSVCSTSTDGSGSKTITTVPSNNPPYTDEDLCNLTDENWFVDLSEVRFDEDGKWLLAPLNNDDDCDDVSPYLTMKRNLDAVETTCGEAFLRSLNRIINLGGFVSLHVHSSNCNSGNNYKGRKYYVSDLSGNHSTSSSFVTSNTRSGYTNSTKSIRTTQYAHLSDA